MEIVFLGTGGGRFNLIRQARRTAGIRINASLNIHIDPGPGVLPACRDFGQDVADTQLLVLTHYHTDHVNDAGLVVEAMTNFATVKNGMLIGSRSVIEGDENGDKGISSYHMGKLSRVEIAKQGTRISIPLKSGKAKGKGKAPERAAAAAVNICPVPVVHDGCDGFGFVLEIGGKRIGYTSDTEYYEGISAHYRGCDVLIANNLKAREDGIPGHLCSGLTAELLRGAKPKLALLTHIGWGLLQSGPEKEAEKIAKLSGVRTVSAEDGMRVNVENLEVLGIGGAKRVSSRSPDANVKKVRGE